MAQGDGASRIAREAQAAGMIRGPSARHYTAEDTLRWLSAQVRQGDTVMVKGPAESRMEQVVAGLLAEPARAAQLLVRQTAGWQKVRLLRPGRPTWLEVDLEAIGHNVRRVVEMVGPGVLVLAVLKADGYGHGDGPGRPNCAQQRGTLSGGGEH